MAKAETASQEVMPPGICVVTPAKIDRDFLAGGFAAALEHNCLEVVILASDTQSQSPGGVIRDLRALVARHGKVFLVEDDIALAGDLEAEGTLVSDLTGLKQTKSRIGPEAMVGVMCGASRHNAMEAGEAGADFVGLKEAQNPEPDDPSFSEHIAWWRELFEIPSVTFGVDSIATATAHLQAGADFVALGDEFWASGTMAKSIETLAALPDET